MTDKEKIQQMMRDMAQGKETASQMMVFNPETKRLEVASADDAAKKDMLRVVPEDMKVSHSRAVSWQEAGK